MKNYCTKREQFICTKPNSGECKNYSESFPADDKCTYYLGGRCVSMEAQKESEQTE